jgi:glutathionylspermidine synthase
MNPMGMSLNPLSCALPLGADVFASVMRRAIFDCCKWNAHSESGPLICPFPLILDQSAWTELGEMAERLAQEVMAAEEELVQRPPLHRRLGLPRSLLKNLGRISKSIPTPGIRLIRFDFHWTTEGWRISEANTDVAGGYIEASGITRLFAEHYPELHMAGDPAESLAEAIANRCNRGAVVAFVHMSVYSDDRQIMLYLAQRFQEKGLRSCLISPDQLCWKDGKPSVRCAWHSGPIDAIFRFVPAEWLSRFWRKTDWSNLVAGGRTPVCNPGYAVLSQSKRFPLIWDQLQTPLPCWRRLLPETRAPDDIADYDESWILKPALGYEGEDIAIERVTEQDSINEIRQRACKNPSMWVAQRRFEVVPVRTPDGNLFPCLGVYVIDGRAAGIFGRAAVRPLIDERAREVVVLIRPEKPS